MKRFNWSNCKDHVEIPNYFTHKFGCVPYAKQSLHYSSYSYSSLLIFSSNSAFWSQILFNFFFRASHPFALNRQHIFKIDRSYSRVITIFCPVITQQKLQIKTENYHSSLLNSCTECTENGRVTNLPSDFPQCMQNFDPDVMGKRHAQHNGRPHSGQNLASGGNAVLQLLQFILRCSKLLPKNRETIYYWKVLFTDYRVHTSSLSWNSLTFPVFLSFFPAFFSKAQKWNYIYLWLQMRL